MGALSGGVMERMRAQARAVKEQMGGRGARTARVFDLTGKNAIVKPGDSVLARLLPRWDVAGKFVRQGEGWAVNPDYVDDVIYFPALEHWWDGPDGKPAREWCPRTFDESARCAVCEAAEELSRSASGEDRQVGKRIAARKSFLFNAVLGRAGKRGLTEGGKADVGVLPANNTVFVAICSFMTGAIGADDDERAAFARGDISDPKDGYDVMLTRPAAQGDRWKVDCAPQSSPLYTQAEAAAFADWMGLLVDLPAMVERELKPYEEVYERYYGQRPPADATEEDPADSFPVPDAAPESPAAQAPDPWAAAAGKPATSPTASAAAPFDPPPSRPAVSAPRASAPRRPSGRR